MSDGEITVTLPIGVARRYTASDSSAGEQLKQALRGALAEHDAKANPLGLPWTLSRIDNGDGPYEWWVRPYGWTEYGRYHTKDQVRLMAAAPELAEALEDAIQRLAELNEQLGDYMPALKKAGLR